MKALATVALSLVAIAASILLLLSTVCAFMAALNSVGGRQLLGLDLGFLIILVAAIWAIVRLNRQK